MPVRAWRRVWWCRTCCRRVTRSCRRSVYQGTYDEATGVWTVGLSTPAVRRRWMSWRRSWRRGNYNNTATRTASTPTDPNAANNTASITVTPFTTADVRIVKTVRAMPTPTIGQNVTFTDRRRPMPVRAWRTGVVVQDLLPSGYTFVSKIGVPGHLRRGDRSVDGGSIERGSTATLDVTATVLATGNYTNTATRTASTPTDPNAANNTASITVTPFSTADVRMLKTAEQCHADDRAERRRSACRRSMPGRAWRKVSWCRTCCRRDTRSCRRRCSRAATRRRTGVGRSGSSAPAVRLRSTSRPLPLATGSYSNTATRTASNPTDPNAANDSVTIVVPPY